MRRLLSSAIAALLFASPAQAQALTPEILLVYAQLGAATLGLKSLEARDLRTACASYRHLLYLQERHPGATSINPARTRELVAFSCR
jgi:hypothetical protein